ncbi:MAG TPA: hypothetical protein VGI83_00475, partial [Gemmatimonadales bacterium]
MHRAYAMLLAAATTAAPLPTPQTPSAYEGLYQSLTGLRADPGKVGQVQNLVLTREAAKFTLTSGTIQLLSPVGGRTVAAVFTGQGTFDFVPSTDIEKDQLNRFIEKREIHESLTTAFFLFTDSTLAEISAKVRFAPGDAGGANDIASDALDYLKFDETKAFDADLLRSIANTDGRPAFYAQVKAHDTYMVTLNPYDAESVQLLRPVDRARHKVSEVLCQFRAVGAPRDTNPLGRDRPLEPIVRSYQVETWLPRDAFGNVSFSATATITVSALHPIGPWIPFVLYSELLLDSVRTPSGVPVVSWKAKDNSVAWLKLSRPLDPSRVDTLRLFYHGDLIERFGDWFFIKTSGTWYPRALGVREASTFDLTFHSPARYVLQSVGDRTDSTVTNEVINTRWVARSPMRNATFNLGLFTRHQELVDGAPPVTVLFSEAGHRALASALVEG